MSDETGSTILAFDVGGTRIKAGLVRGTTLERFEVGPSGEDPLEAVATLGRTLLDDGDAVDKVGICTPGLIADNVVESLPGKLEGLQGRDLAGFARDTFDKPGFAINDALAYGLGEAVAGAGRGAERVVVVTIGTGVGVACISGGQPVTSGRVGGGILGGMIPITEISERRDSAGRWGTIEALCCAQRIVDGSGGHFTSVTEVFQAHADGDVDALHGIDRYRRSLVRALAALAHAHAPEIIVVGGGPLTDDSPLLDGVQESVDSTLFPGYSVDVRRAALGDAAALIGLAHLGQDR